MSRPVSIAIVNDYALSVADLHRLLDSYDRRVEIIETVSGDADLETSVDVALYDTFGRAGLGIDRLTQLLADPKAEKVALYTAALPSDVAPLLWSLGVTGCFAKSLPTPDLVRSIERVASGERVLALRANGGAPDFSTGDLALSYREAEVLALLSQGLRNRAIAHALHVGEETIKSHLKSIYRKLGVSSRGEAIALAYQSPGFALPVADYVTA